LVAIEFESEIICQTGLAYLLVASSSAATTLTEVNWYFPLNENETGQTGGLSPLPETLEARPDESGKNLNSFLVKKVSEQAQVGGAQERSDSQQNVSVSRHSVKELTV